MTVCECFTLNDYVSEHFQVTNYLRPSPIGAGHGNSRKCADMTKRKVRGIERERERVRHGIR